MNSKRNPWTALAACVVTSLACSSTRPTEIVAGVSTQIRVPDGLQAVGMIVKVGGDVVFCDHYRVTDGYATLPATLGVLGETGLERRGTVLVQVVGFRTDDSQFGDTCSLTSPEETGLDAMVLRSRK